MKQLSRNETVRHLHSAKKAKNDEFYTQLSDIEKELKHYKHSFKGKTVLCNCDDPRVSNFFHYFSYNFEKLGLKKLISTCYKNKERDFFSKNDSEQAIYLVYEGDKNNNNVPDPEEIGIKYFQGDGDFRSEEAIELLKQADIVVTNPPFSIFREYVAQLIEYKKQFLIIGNLNAMKYGEIYPYFQSDEIWFGATMFSGGAAFFVGSPDLYDPEKMSNPKNAYIKDGKLYWRVNGVRWFTNIDHNKRHEELVLYKTYNPDDYPKYDNYDAIEVPFTECIPSDYDGIMGVPISFLNKYNPEQFEILGATQRGCHDEVPDTRKYDDYWEMKQNGERTGSSGGKTNENANLLGNDGKKNYFINKDGRVIQSAYQRLFIKHRR
ncbi:MAG: adenine-specific methyltransferase EcoRI family protein [Mangrovimonas sp.]|nr:adenine-specific methyltransferase EcoRI family protein [Mangrovimonas sp.]